MIRRGCSSLLSFHYPELSICRQPHPSHPPCHIHRSLPWEGGLLETSGTSVQGGCAPCPQALLFRRGGLSWQTDHLLPHQGRDSEQSGGGGPGDHRGPDHLPGLRPGDRRGDAPAPAGQRHHRRPEDDRGRGRGHGGDGPGAAQREPGGHPG